MTPERFERRMKELGEKVETGSHEIVRRAALAADRELVLSTPVDTGRARSNWLVGIDGPRRETVGAMPTSTAIARAQDAIEASRSGQSIWISNNLPYIGRLNDGYSAQAPAGFVERAILRGAESVRSARVLR